MFMSGMGNDGQVVTLGIIYWESPRQVGDLSNRLTSVSALINRIRIIRGVWRSGIF